MPAAVLQHITLHTTSSRGEGCRADQAGSAHCRCTPDLQQHHLGINITSSRLLSLQGRQSSGIRE